MEKSTGSQFGSEGLDAAYGIRHVVKDTDAVDPVEFPFQLIDIINTKLPKLSVGGPRAPTPFLGCGQGSFAQVNA
jgi:hypothetical protein